MNQILDKLILVEFICNKCKKESFITADKRCEFASYMQCCYCGCYLAIFNQPMSTKIQVRTMDDKEVNWLLKLKACYKDTQTL